MTIEKRRLRVETRRIGVKIGGVSVVGGMMPAQVVVTILIRRVSHDESRHHFSDAVSLKPATQPPREGNGLYSISPAR
jgi:hypothetical protein